MKTFILLFITAGFGFFTLSCAKDQSKNIIEEQIICVKAENITQTVSSVPVHSAGVLSSKRITKLSFKTGGIINAIMVEEGSAVKKGQVLASLDMTEISAQVQQAIVAYEKAGRDFERAKNLYKDTVITLEQLQNATSAYKAALETKNIAEFNLRYSKITAPANGKIIGKLAEENELTAPGMPVLVLSEQGSDEWVVKTGISDRDLMAIKKGDKASVSFDAFGDKVFEGKITQLAELADPLSGTFEVEVSVNPGETQFINGLVASIEIFSSDKRTVTLVPPDAVTEANGSKGYVYLVDDKNSTAKKTSVTISYIHNKEIAVLEPLGKMGKVITRGAAYLEDGSRIEIIN